MNARMPQLNSMRATTVSWSPRYWLAMLSICACMVSLALAGCTTRAKTDVDREQRAMRTMRGTNWYDSNKVGYRTPKVSKETDSPVRTTGWEAPPKAIKPAPAPGTGAGWGWGFMNAGISIYIWLVLGVLLLALAALLAGASVRGWGRKPAIRKQTQAIQIDPARVVDLPFEAKVEMDDPLAAARQLANAGDYDAAVQFLYGYMLLALDRAGQIVLHRGKTNRMYLFELAGQRTLRDLMNPVMLAFEDVFFGRHKIDRDRFVQLWNNLDHFHRELQPVMQGRELAAQAVAT